MNIGLLFFSSMLKPAEQYLSKEIKDKTTFRGRNKNLKARISKAVDNKIGLFRKKAVKVTLDNQIETAIEDTKVPQNENIINEPLIKEKTEGFNSKSINYRTQINKIPAVKKSSFKNLYTAFIGYTKSSYKSMKRPKKFINLNPEQVGYELDRYSKRFRIIRAPKINGKSYLTL